MARTLEEIEADVQELGQDDKERLQEALLDDVGPTDPAVECAWLEEVQKRSRELDEGTVTAVSWEEVAADVRSRLRKNKKS